MSRKMAIFRCFATLTATMAIIVLGLMVHRSMVTHTNVLAPLGIAVEMRNPFQEEASITYIPRKRSYTVPGCSCARTGYNAKDIQEMRSKAQEQPELFPAWFLEKYSNSGESTCSDFATQRGGGQKVLAYVYYTSIGKTIIGSPAYKKYISQFYKTVGFIKTRYPGWIVRVYHNVTLDDANGMAELCKIYCDHDYVDLCHAHNLPGLGNLTAQKLTGMLWRFAPMGDPTVDVFLSRDTDSWVLPREVAAVNQWLETNRTFHLVHDHPSHRAKILGGFWGARNNNPKLMLELRAKLYNSTPNEAYAHDQHLLEAVVWPIAQNDNVNHNSYNCLIDYLGPSIPFPTKREGVTYCGYGTYKVHVSHLIKNNDCPVECRPEQHKDWNKC